MTTISKTKSARLSRKKRTRGQSLVEYVALTALIAIVCISTVKLFGGKVRTRLNQVTNHFDRNIQAGLKNAHSRGEPVNDGFGDDGMIEENERPQNTRTNSRGNNGKGIFGGLF